MRTPFMLKHQIEKCKRERRRPVAPPSSSHRRRYSARYGLTDPSNLHVYFVGPAEFTRHDFEHRRTQAWVDWSPPLVDWQTLWVDWRQPPTMFFFVGGGEGAARARKTMANRCCELRRRDSRRRMRLDRYKGSKPKELFLQSKEAVQENESDRREIAQGRHEIQGRHRKERNFTSQ